MYAKSGFDTCFNPRSLTLVMNLSLFDSVAQNGRWIHSFHSQVPRPIFSTLEAICIEAWHLKRSSQFLVLAGSLNISWYEIYCAYLCFILLYISLYIHRSHDTPFPSSDSRRFLRWITLSCNYWDLTRNPRPFFRLSMLCDWRFATLMPGMGVATFRGHSTTRWLGKNTFAGAIDTMAISGNYPNWRYLPYGYVREYPTK